MREKFFMNETGNEVLSVRELERIFIPYTLNHTLECASQAGNF